MKETTILRNIKTKIEEGKFLGITEKTYLIDLLKREYLKVRSEELNKWYFINGLMG